MTLRRAIVLALIVKAIILALLWKAFFAQPQARHMRMPSEAVAQHLIQKANHVPPR